LSTNGDCTDLYQPAKSLTVIASVAKQSRVRAVPSGLLRRLSPPRNDESMILQVGINSYCLVVAVRRAETRTGADYYLGAPGAVMDDLEASARLEVSGTDYGGESVIKGLLRQKLEQASKGRSNLPAIASVVGFRALQIISADVE
jgi:hypothetical protein